MNEKTKSAGGGHAVKGYGVTAVLGPTNTGKTHLAIERMLGHDTGLIGLPLRLLAREVYDRVVKRVGERDVALITGEERIKPKHPRYYVCTVEAMPRSVEVDFLAVDEIQLAGDPERGHIFTDRLFSARGQEETLLLGSSTMRDVISDVLPGSNHVSRPRLSKLTYGGQKKITRLPRRSAVVAFSANDVYAIAELVRRQRGGAAVVLGALSPRTRNAQVALYQSGDVDYLVATDAIGMGLNLDVDHVAFAGTHKFDGELHRELTVSELAQIAGRAGRHMNDGTFGVTANVQSFNSECINRLEAHEFESVKLLQWRASELDFASLERLKKSLKEAPRTPRLTRARMSDDVIALENVSHDKEIVRSATSPAAIRRLWDVCQIPDYRKISAVNHSELIAKLYKFIISENERIPEDWFASQVAQADRTDGDIDTLAQRIAHIRTWTFVSNRADWLADPAHWQARTREIEDNLSDALHEQLTKRFVDRRTAVLMKRLRDEEDLQAEISKDGEILVENHYVGQLKGFVFTPDANADGIHGRAARNAASKVLTSELAMRARRISAAKANQFSLAPGGRVIWRDEEIAYLTPGEDPLKPELVLLSDEYMSGPDREKVTSHLKDWLADYCSERLHALYALANAEEITGLARGIAYRLKENFGILKREDVAAEMRSLDQAARSQLRKYGVRFGAFNVYFPSLLKPSVSELLVILWTLKNNGQGRARLEDTASPPRAGLTSLPVDKALDETFYRAAGFHMCGERAVRIDMLERLADMIRPLIAWRARKNAGQLPPAGATGDGGFTIQPGMMSILGCSAEEIGKILTSLGFRMERHKLPAGSPMNTETKPADDVPPRVDGAGQGGEGAALTVDAGQDAAARNGKSASPADASKIADGSAPEMAQRTEAEGGQSPEIADELYEEIWRPRRRRGTEKVSGQARGTTAKEETARPRRRKGRSADLHRGVAKAGPRKRPKTEKPVDPDSPFAALAKLKEDLEKRLPEEMTKGQ